MSDSFYRWFSKQLLTAFSSAWHGRIEQSRLALLQAAASPSGDILETGTGLLTAHAVSSGSDAELAVRNIGVETGLTRDLLAARTLLANRPGLDAPSRDTQSEGPLLQIQKQLFETLAFIARSKPAP